MNTCFECLLNKNLINVVLNIALHGKQLKMLVNCWYITHMYFEVSDIPDSIYTSFKERLLEKNCLFMTLKKKYLLNHCSSCFNCGICKYYKFMADRGFNSVNCGIIVYGGWSMTLWPGIFLMLPDVIHWKFCHFLA